MYKRITNRTTRVERLARIVDDIIGEAQNEPLEMSNESIDRAIRLNVIDDLDRIAASLELIAENRRKNSDYH